MIPLRLLVCAMVLALFAASTLFTSSASPLPTDVTVGVVIPLSGGQTIRGNRVKSVLEYMLNQYNAGVTQGSLVGNSVGAPVNFVYRDSQDDPVTSMSAVFDLHSNYPNLMGIIGDLNDNITTPMALLTSTLNIFSISPASSCTSLADKVDYRYNARTVLSDEVVAQLWVKEAVEAKWFRVALLSTDDDSARGVVNVLLRHVAETTVTAADSNTTSNPFEVKSYVFPARPSVITTNVIEQAMSEIATSSNRIFFLHANEMNEAILRSAYAHGLMGMGADGVVRQWTGTFCTADIRTRFQKEPWILAGTYCIAPARPRVFPDRSTDATLVAFQSALQAAYPSYYSADRPITYESLSTANAFITMMTVIKEVINDPSKPNTAQSMVDVLLRPLSITQLSQDTVRFHSNGDLAADADVVNWNTALGDFITLSTYDLDTVDYFGSDSSYHLEDATDVDVNVPTYAAGMSEIPKDRPRIYVDYDELPMSFDGKIIVLTYVVCVLGAWTALILLEQALSFWSRGVWKQALGWVALASLAFGSCSIWPNAIMSLSSITLDVDASLWMKDGPLIGSAVFPIAGVFLSFFITITSVQGGLKPAPNVNVNEVSDVTGSSTTNNSQSGSNSRSSVAQLKQLTTKLTKKLAKFKEFVVDTAILSTWRIPLAAGILAATMTTQLLVVERGFYWKVHFSNVPHGQSGAFLYAFFVNLVSLSMYFHVTRSVMRYAAPFILAITTLGHFFLTFFAANYTYDTSVSIESADVKAFTAANGTLATAVAIAAAAVCVALMALNVNRLRQSRNTLDKVLNQVSGQLKTIESDIETEKAQRKALIEQADFFRRTLEVVNLCRPIWRPYAVAIALTDPDEVSAEALKIASAPVLPAPEHKLRLKPKGGSANSANGSKDNKQNDLGVPSKKGSAASRDKSASKSGGGAADAASGAAAEPSVKSSQGIEGKGITSGVTINPGAPSVDQPNIASPNALSATNHSEPKSASKGSGTKKITVASKPTDAVFSSNPSISSSSKEHMPETAAVANDWTCVHAHKKEKQLAAILRELSELGNLDAPVPSKVLQDIKLPQILSHPATLELMKDVLAKNLSPENISLWIDIQRYRSLENNNIRKAVADEIFQTFIANGAKFEVNLSSFMRDYVATQINKNKITIDLFDEVEKEIYRLMVTNNVDALLNSPMFKLSALLLMHPQYKLKNVSLVNNFRGEIGGNEEPIFAVLANEGLRSNAPSPAAPLRSTTPMAATLSNRFASPSASASRLAPSKATVATAGAVSNTPRTNPLFS